MLYSVRLISPAFNNVYDALSEEQKAKFRMLGQQLQQFGQTARIARDSAAEPE